MSRGGGHVASFRLTAETCRAPEQPCLAVQEYGIECPFILDRLNAALRDVYLAGFSWVFSS